MYVLDAENHRAQMSAGHDHAATFDGMNEDYKRRLMLVTGINIAMFFVEMGAGSVAGSQALKADALDFFADGITYALSFWAIGRAANMRTGAAVLVVVMAVVRRRVGADDVGQCSSGRSGVGVSTGIAPDCGAFVPDRT